MDDLNFARPECEIDQPFNPFDDPSSWDYPDDVDAEYLEPPVYEDDQPEWME